MSATSHAYFNSRASNSYLGAAMTPKAYFSRYFRTGKHKQRLIVLNFAREKNALFNTMIYLLIPIAYIVAFFDLVGDTIRNFVDDLNIGQYKTGNLVTMGISCAGLILFVSIFFMYYA